MHKKNLFSTILVLSIFSSALSAQELSTDPVYQHGATVLEQTLPPSPDAASRTRYTDAQIGYSSTLSRWMVLDPLSEKYYGISPYAYCGGNPMAAVDPEGNALHVVVGALIGSAVETGIELHQGKTGSELLGAAARGAIDGGFIAATGPGGILKDVAIGALSSAVGSAADQLISTGEIESDKIIRDSAVGGVLGGGGHYVDAIFSKFSKNMIKKRPLL